MRTLDGFRDEKTGELVSYVWPGGYPVFYLDKQGNVLCPECANRPVDQVQEVVAADVNWEDGALYCDDCGRRIESAYGEEK